MKNLAMTLGVLLLSSCEMANLKYGYYWNPMKVLSQAEEGIRENNLNKFTDVLSNSALCNYGSEDGMRNLREALNSIDSSTMNAPVKISGKHLSKPVWNGYYIYYQEKYVTSAKDLNGEPLLKIIIVCDFGDNIDSNQLLKAPSSSYNTVSCSINEIKNFHDHLSNPICN